LKYCSYYGRPHWHYGVPIRQPELQLEGWKLSLLDPFLGLFLFFSATKCITCTGIWIFVIRFIFDCLVGAALERRNLLLKVLDLTIPPVKYRLLEKNLRTAVPSFPTCAWQILSPSADRLPPTRQTNILFF
jgi:hypothetical protein